MSTVLIKFSFERRCIERFWYSEYVDCDAVFVVVFLLWLHFLLVSSLLPLIAAVKMLRVAICSFIVGCHLAFLGARREPDGSTGNCCA